MENILDYLKWRGDIPFDRVPLNKVDFLIFAQYAYCPFERICEESYGKTFFEIKDEMMTSPSPARVLFHGARDASVFPFKAGFRSLWESLGENSRFGGIRLKDFVCSFNPEIDKQFAAVCLKAGKACIVSFRGTDSTIVGWKEDFNLGLEKPVPAQKAAVEFLEKWTGNEKEVYVCGHSKGGNLAMFSASQCSSRTRKKIKGVYNFDGPGLSETVLASDGWKEIKQRIVSIIPEESIIGLLLGYSEDYKVVVSDSISLLQHDPFNWHIKGSDFEYARCVSSSSKNINEKIRKFLQDCPVDRRKVLVETLFDILNATGAQRVKDIPKGILFKLPEVAKVITRISAEDREALKEMEKMIMN